MTTGFQQQSAQTTYPIQRRAAQPQHGARFDGAEPKATPEPPHIVDTNKAPPPR